jgi:hypothetical protein
MTCCSATHTSCRSILVLVHLKLSSHQKLRSPLISARRRILLIILRPGLLLRPAVSPLHPPEQRPPVPDITRPTTHAVRHVLVIQVLLNRLRNGDPISRRPRPSPDGAHLYRPRGGRGNRGHPFQHVRCGNTFLKQHSEEMGFLGGLHWSVGGVGGQGSRFLLMLVEAVPSASRTRCANLRPRRNPPISPINLFRFMQNRTVECRSAPWRDEGLRCV